MSLLIGGTLLLVGFAASLVFERFRLPDFFVLLVLGVVLGHLPYPPFGPTLAADLGPIVPTFLQLTLALILFEGGLALQRPERRGGGHGILAVHIAVSMGVTMALTWFLTTAVLGLAPITGLVFAAAFSGPSATIVLSFAPQMNLGPRALGTIVLEGVLGNVLAAVVVLLALDLPGVSGLEAIAPYVAYVALAAAFGAALGFLWRAATTRLLPYKFQYIATLGLALVVYAFAEGVLGGNGLVAAFALGLMVGRRRAEWGAPAESQGGLRAFQSEVTFGLRTFLFVYLGLLIQFESLTLEALLGATVLVLGFLVARAPTSVLLGRAYRLPRRERRVILATIARGMTDVVLVLLAVESLLLPPQDVPRVIAVLPLIILGAAVGCGGLLAWAGRGAESPGTAAKS